MAFTKSTKVKMMEDYSELIEKSQAIFMLEYSKMNMKVIDDIRRRVREAGGEVHVVKNTLFQKVLASNEIETKDKITGTTLVGFAFEDIAQLAKTVNDIVKDGAFKIKGAYLDKEPLNASQVKKLADLPTLPVMRATLLGTIMAPATQLARVLSEPGRSVAAVVQAHVNQSESAAA
ncbi:MAG: 50S ribosomal protein L10 [Chloroflexi bacterium]|nr:50S ribosomal protein L10 [Chloroflexota bacterium]